MITKDDEVYAVGSNGAGCLGLGDMHSTLFPKKVDTLCAKVFSKTILNQIYMVQEINDSPIQKNIYFYTKKYLRKMFFVHRGLRASRTEVGRMFLHIHSQERSIRGDTMDIVNLATVQQTRVTKR